MSELIVKVPLRVNRYVKIIRDPKLIEEELEKRRQRLNILVEEDFDELLNDDDELIPEMEMPDPSVIDEEMQEEAEPQPPFVPEFYQKVIISNYDTPVEFDLSKVKEPSLPISIVKEEIQRAYDSGMADGHIQAKAILDTELSKYERRLADMDKVLKEVHHQFRRHNERLELSVVDIAITMAKFILDKETESDSMLALRQAQKVIRELEDEKPLKIEVSSSDYEIMQEYKSQLLEDRNEANKIHIVASSMVKKGGCVVHTSGGILDARIASQLETLTPVLNQALADELKENTSTQDTYDELRDSILDDEDFNASNKIENQFIPEIKPENDSDIVAKELLEHKRAEDKIQEMLEAEKAKTQDEIEAEDFWRRKYEAEIEEAELQALDNENAQAKGKLGEDNESEDTENINSKDLDFEQTENNDNFEDNSTAETKEPNPEFDEMMKKIGKTLNKKDSDANLDDDLDDLIFK